MLRLVFALILAVPVTAKLKVDTNAALVHATQEADLLRSDAKHWQMEKETLEELLDNRDSLSPTSQSKQRFLGQLDHAEKQRELAEAALVQQTLEVTKLQASKPAASADLSGNPWWNPTQQGAQALTYQFPGADAFGKKNKERREHNHNHQHNVPNGTCQLEMKNQLSGKNNRGDCVSGVTFGCIGDSDMWVNDGCRATFKCNGGHEKCESFSYRFKECRCKDAKKPKDAKTSSLLESKPKSYFNPMAIMQDFTDTQVKKQVMEMKKWQNQGKDDQQKAKHAAREQGRVTKSSLMQDDNEEPAEGSRRNDELNNQPH